MSGVSNAWRSSYEINRQEPEQKFYGEPRLPNTQRNPLRIYSRIGAAVPLHSTAVGKVLLAYMPIDEQTRVLSGPHLQRLTPSSVLKGGASKSSYAASTHFQVPTRDRGSRKSRHQINSISQQHQ